MIAAQIEQADVLAINEPQTLRLMNGKLPIYIRFGTVKPAAVVQPFLATWQPQQFEKIEGAEDFTNRLQKNMQALKKWAVKENIFCLRLYDADLPDFNIAVDLYGDRLHVQEYAPPKTIDPEKAKKTKTANPYTEVTEWFTEGNNLDVTDTLTNSQYKKALMSVPSLCR